MKVVWLGIPKKPRREFCPQPKNVTDKFRKVVIDAWTPLAHAVLIFTMPRCAPTMSPGATKAREAPRNRFFCLCLETTVVPVTPSVNDYYEEQRELSLPLIAPQLSSTLEVVKLPTFARRSSTWQQSQHQSKLTTVSGRLSAFSPSQQFSMSCFCALATAAAVWNLQTGQDGFVG